jgi:hypothetical protein
MRGVQLLRHSVTPTILDLNILFSTLFSNDLILCCSLGSERIDFDTHEVEVEVEVMRLPLAS